MQSETRTKSAGLCEWTRNATHTPVDSIAIRAVQNGILNKKPGEPNENHRTQARFTGWLADVCKGSARVCAKNPVGVAQVVALDECAAATLNAVPGYPKDGLADREAEIETPVRSGCRRTWGHRELHYVPVRPEQQWLPQLLLSTVSPPISLPACCKPGCRFPLRQPALPAFAQRPARELATTSPRERMEFGLGPFLTAVRISGNARAKKFSLRPARSPLRCEATQTRM